jgi:hypothetical protein
MKPRAGFMSPGAAFRNGVMNYNSIAEEALIEARKLPLD